MSAPPYLRLPPGVNRHTVSTAGGPLAALCASPSGTAAYGDVLLVPGFTGSKEDFVAVLPTIAAAGHRVMAIDLRGQLDPSGPGDPAAYAVGALAGEVLEVARGLRPPVHLLGHSYGGLVARAAVLADRSAVRSLTLLGSGPSAIPGPRAERLRLLRPVLDSGGVAAVWEATCALDAADPAYVAPAEEVAAFLRQRFLAHAPGCLPGMAQALLDEPDRVAELAATGVPLLVAHGVADDAWPPDVQAEMAGRLGARHAVVPAAAHSPAAENPTATVDVLLPFWRSVERRQGTA